MATFSAPTPVLLADSQPAPTGGVMVSNSDFRVLLAKVETTMDKVETIEAHQKAAGGVGSQLTALHCLKGLHQPPQQHVGSASSYQNQASQIQQSTMTSRH